MKQDLQDPSGSVLFSNDVYRTLTHQAYDSYKLFENQIIDDFIDNGCLVKSKLVSSKDVPGLDDGISESGYVIKQTKIPLRLPV